MENGAIEYLSFVRGFVAASDHDEDRRAEAAHPDAYAAGYAEGARRNGYPVTYRELTRQHRDSDRGAFAGTLELPADDLTPLSGTLDPVPGWFTPRPALE
ncbi:hypothetical protein B0I33_105105 [Prauserella shujinwangii]|uniref:Uncharacterized protein n=1 Tax=Prauserella shujinwangii TaxID=1453103 RepID=A0A2T0LUQ4_9PSEU|nr:hypothetical protein [Prauserella shujinwangii]PRX47527.1 hypothetical protein B0I33_105105 [Prauserella shujinwangii]